ncbi:hypothetical protein ABIA71_001671 [Stenotrophomonas sp. 2619]|uniref:hypothetical protein n=1 Tax=Stenotrophomonas sp. 2619 TaxID=3156316 RepID=UPI003391B232
MDTITNQIALRLGYLNIVQGVINRLANSVSAMKGASVAVMAAMLACALGQGAALHWAVLLPPGVLFMGFHAYFLQYERAFIALYNDAADRALDDVVPLRIDLRRLRALRDPLLAVLCRPTVLGFHVLLVGGCVGALLLAQGAR